MHAKIVQKLKGNIHEMNDSCTLRDFECYLFDFEERLGDHKLQEFLHI